MNALKDYLRTRGASLVGFADVEGRYAGDESVSPVPRLPRAVAIAVALPREVVRDICEKPSRAYFDAYHALNRQLDSLAQLCEAYLRRVGYQAYAQTTDRLREFGTYETALPHKTVARLSGLGWIGKSALLVTKEFGGAVRLSSVLTDAPLPVDILAENRCGNCTLCTRACPAGAITGALWTEESGRDAIFDPLKCRAKAREIARSAIGETITLCGKCFAVCPWTLRYAEG